MCKESADNTYRMFSCSKCRKLVTICSKCDRGNRYCSKDCSRAARQASLKRSQKRYQRTLKGAKNHAKRQRRYRQRRNKVTHHSSLHQTKLVTSRTNVASPALYYCCICSKQGSQLVRQRFLGRRGTKNGDTRRRNRDPTSVLR